MHEVHVELRPQVGKCQPSPLPSKNPAAPVTAMVGVNVSLHPVVKRKGRCGNCPATAPLTVGALGQCAGAPAEDNSRGQAGTARIVGGEEAAEHFTTDKQAWNGIAAFVQHAAVGV